MTNKFNLCALLEKYSYSHKINEKELDFLDKCWKDSLENADSKNIPSIAPAIVCDKAGVERGSYWISCNAAILDKIRPLADPRSRSTRIFDALNQSGLIAA